MWNNFDIYLFFIVKPKKLNIMSSEVKTIVLLIVALAIYHALVHHFVIRVKANFESSADELETYEG
jgi:hypothetical protein